MAFLSGVPHGFQYLNRTPQEEGASVPRGKSLLWEVHGPSSPDSLNLENEDAHKQTLKRYLGPTEASYYLGSGQNGVNDMYLHIGFKSPPLSKSTILSIWTIQLQTHHLLASTVEFTKGQYEEIMFRYDPPRNGLEATKLAEDRIEFLVSQDPKEYLEAYLNGPRTLSDQLLAKLVISTPSSTFDSPDKDGLQEYDYYLFSTHFLGDGMALHTTANEFFNLLGDALEKEKMAELSEKEETEKESMMRELVPIQTGELARAMESKVLVGDKWRRLAWAGARVSHSIQQGRDIGNHSFPRANLGPRHTLVPTISYSPTETSRILSICKSHKSTISHAVFALANIAYIKSMGGGEGREWPMMLYSALNVRGNLIKSGKGFDGENVGVGDWYHIAIGYYNIILPTFIPSSITASQTFWSRAHSTRTQTSRIVKSPLINSRTLIMALERESRSIGFERADDKKRAEKMREERMEMKGLGISFGELKLDQEESAGEKIIAEEKKEVEVVEKIPSVALLGVSMLGNLDAMYTHSTFPGIKLHTLTTGSRQRAGAILLFAYTFAGKLWLSLGYDKNGFKEGVVEKWWEEVQGGVREFLLEEEK